LLLRGEAHRAAIRSVLDAFGEDAVAFVFVGGCTLGLYARPAGAPLRATKDVDCISTLSPWVLQEKKLADMCSQGVLSPDPEVPRPQCWREARARRRARADAGATKRAGAGCVGLSVALGAPVARWIGCAVWFVGGASLVVGSRALSDIGQ
jgi:hypothetical protein